MRSTIALTILNTLATALAGAILATPVAAQNAPPHPTTANKQIAIIAPPPRKPGRPALPPTKIELLTANPQLIPARQIQFPKDVNCGGLILCSQVRTSFNNDNSDEPTMKAQGLVKIPAGKFVWFAPSVHLFQHPHALDHLPVNAFEGLLFRFTAVDDADEGKADSTFTALCRFSGLKLVDVDNSEITDKGLQSLAKITDLEFLSAARTQLNGSFMKNCFNPNLRYINLDGTLLEPANVRYLNHFANLRSVRLAYTRIDNEAIKSLASARSLQVLDIGNIKEIDDGVAKTLLSIKTLAWLKDNRTGLSLKSQQQMESAGIYVEPPSDFPTQKLSPKALKQLNRAYNRGSGRTNELKDLFRPLSRDRGL